MRYRTVEMFPGTQPGMWYLTLYHGDDDDRPCDFEISHTAFNETRLSVRVEFVQITGSRELAFQMELLTNGVNQGGVWMGVQAYKYPVEVLGAAVGIIRDAEAELLGMQPLMEGSSGKMMMTAFIIETFGDGSKWQWQER